uniref:proline-rich protein 5-like isoform X2 n=1 Tax=Podarcis muralis TaxID=64176 RepID=UPI00109FA422|nr:proline-rich protein 5-like isoform X2 [Podarcis muralis]
MTKDSTIAPALAFQFQKMGSFRRPRPRFMSSPVLTDLPRFLAARQSLQLSSNSAWNSVQTAVINVFKGGGLQNNELYILNENVRRLLKSELGSFITDYFQNQLLSKGLLFMEEKVKLCEEENRIDILSELWDHFFTETLPTLQAIFYPVQGVHEPTGPSKAFMQLEELVKLVVSPYLGLCEEHCFPGSTCALERRYHRPRAKPNGLSFSSHAVADRQVSETALTPLTEQEGEAYLEKCGNIRRHTVANAHSDIQLLAMASIMHSGMVVEEPDSGDTCLLLQPSLNHRQCSSEPTIVDGPEGLGTASMQEPTELNCTSVC